jgi:membrane-bound lytic murein transglycosylase F
MPKHAPILTRRRLLLGSMAAGIVALAILLLQPDMGQGFSGASPYGEPVDRDLDAIRNDTLRVLVIQHHLVYTRSKGAESGLEFELLERIARDIGVPIKAIVVARPDSLLPMLQRGEGDVLAAHLGQRNPFDRWVIHTVPYRYESPVYATLRPDHVLGINLGDRTEPDTAWVSVWSPFAPNGLRFPGNDGDADLTKRTVFTDTSRFGDQAVINVALGRVRAAIVSDAAAAYFAQRFPQIAFSEPFDAPVPLVFGLRANARQLQRAIDQRLSDPLEKEAMAMLMSAYGTNLPERGPLGAVPCTTTEGAALPGYDHHPREDGLSRDWALLAAIAFQGGLPDTSLIPVEALDRYRSLDSIIDPRQARDQVAAVAHYLAELDSLWRGEVPDHTQRLRFVAAAYNSGPGHVMDACSLAQKLQMDPQRWEGNVERAITLLSLPRYFSDPVVKNGPCKGDEAFIRVREMVCLYDHYRAAGHP